MRYIIIEKELGVFVGQYDIYAIYAKNEIFGADKVVSFETFKNASEYLEDHLNYEDKEFHIEGIESSTKYVLVKDIIKSGLGQYTHNMMENIPMPSEAIH